MLNISGKLVSQIQYEAEKAYPNECCGFILGSLSEKCKSAQQILPCNNSSESNEKYHRFVITPEDMLKAERLARFIKLDIIGFYHSHPDCAAKPSDYDTSHALPIYSYVIVSAVQGKSADFKSWVLDDESCKQFQSEVINTEKGEKFLWL
jgi:proteasome lid subunit RPN8/RPN11